jgi:hypothetical protein
MPALTPQERKDQLGRGAQADIARTLKLTEGHVSQVVAGTREDLDVVNEVCRRLRKSRSQVFPEYSRSKKNRPTTREGSRPI